MSTQNCSIIGGAPPMNTDISGTGVRVSFYLQALLLACLSARSGSLDEITGALYTLVATNFAMAVTSLILGFHPNGAQMSLQDAIVVFYLLSLSWAAVFFSLPSYNRFVKSDRTLQYLSIVQSYVLFAFALSILIKAKAFGSNPECNANAVVVLYHEFNALHQGRIVAWIFVILVIVIYTFLTISDYLPLVKRWYRKLQHQGKREPRNPSSLEKGVTQTTPSNNAEVNKPKKKKHEHPQSHQEKKEIYDIGVSGSLIIEIIVIFILWALTVMNTELLIVKNRFEGGDTSTWQFGQILPMFLVILPLVNMVKAFRKYGFQRRTHRRKVHKKPVQSAQRRPKEHRRENLRDSTFTATAFDRQGMSGLGDGVAFGTSLFSPRFERPDGSLPTARISAHSIHSETSPAPSRRSTSTRHSAQTHEIERPYNATDTDTSGTP